MNERDRARQMAGLGIVSERHDGVQVITLNGELDIDGAPRLEDELRRAEESDASSIVVDLGQLDFIDSTGIRMLVMAAERVPDGRLSILPGPAQVQRVFEITDLTDRLPFA